MSKRSRGGSGAPAPVDEAARLSDDAALHLRTVLDHVPVVLFAIGRDEVFTLSEGRGLAVLGLKPGEVVGRPVAEVYREVPEILRHVRRALGGESFSATVEVSGRVFETRYEAVRDPGGELAGLVGVATDVTARARYEARLAESEQRFRQITENIQEVFWMYETRGPRMLYASPAFEPLFGITRQSLYADIGVYFDSVHPDDRERVRQIAGRPEAAEGTECEYRILHPDGSMRWVRTRGFPVPGPEGRWARIAGITEDITARREGEEELRRTVARLEATLEATPAGILVVDETGRVTAFNRRMTEIWGLDPERLANAGIDQLRQVLSAQVHDPQAFVEDSLGMALRPDAEHFGLIRLRDDRELECHSVPQRIDGRPVGRVLSFRDITERRRAQERLRAQEEELAHAQKMDVAGRVAGGVAHDFNNLLTAILGHSQLLVDALPPGAAGHESATEIQAAGRRAADLTRVLLAFGRKQPIEMTSVDLHAVLDEVLPMLRAALGEAVVVVQRREAPEAWVRGDRAGLEQLITNLAMNARDAMSRRGTLTIETATVVLAEDSAARPVNLEPGPYLRVRVSDTGVGMSEAVRARAFEPFFTTKDRGMGLGLGLALAYATMARCGGNIHVESAAGKGAVFTLWFPPAPAAAPGAAAAAAAAPAERVPLPVVGGSETLLVVEDEEVVRQLMVRALEALGYRVCSAASADEALAGLDREGTPPALLITDVVMPGRSGLELTERVRARMPDLPVVWISGHADEAVARRLGTLPGVTFLEKPFSADALARLVRERLDARASERAS